MDRGQIVKKEALEMGRDDVTGLYEIIWRLNTLWPEIGVGEKYRLADEALRELLKQKGVRIVRPWLKNGQTYVEAVDPEKTDEILRSPVSWYPSASDDPWSQMAYETTVFGETLIKKFYERE